MQGNAKQVNCQGKEKRGKPCAKVKQEPRQGGSRLCSCRRKARRGTSVAEARQREQDKCRGKVRLSKARRDKPSAAARRDEAMYVTRQGKCLGKAR
jgi:hypothetical protein